MQPTKPKHSARSFADYAFGGSRLDAMHMTEPRISGSVCGVLNSVLYSPDVEPGGGGGGDDKRFTQADLDRVVTERLKRESAKYADYDQIKAQVADLAKKNAESEADAQRRAEEAELKGKSEAEQGKIQLAKATENYKKLEAERAKERAEFEGQLKSEREAHLGFRKQTQVQSALNAAGLAKGADKFAVQAFLSEAQIELDEQHGIKSIAVGGQSFSKLDEASKKFLADNPLFAAPAQGGSGGPRSAFGGAGGGSVDNINTLTGLLSAGLAQHDAKAG